MPIAVGRELVTVRRCGMDGVKGTEPGHPVSHGPGQNGAGEIYQVDASR